VLADRTNLAFGISAFCVQVSAAARQTEAVPNSPLSIKMVSVRNEFRLLLCVVS